MIDPLQPDYANTPASSRRPSFGYVPTEHGAVPGVTIITPFFNTGAVFRETARSVLRQSFQQWEWVIVDDGSSHPDSLALLAEYAALDSRIRIVRHDRNRGLSAARNTGFREARAPNVVPLDSDDLLEPTAVEKWLWFLESHPEYAFVKGYTVGFGAQEYLWHRGFHDRRGFLRENLVAHTSMIRRSVHAAVGGYDEDIRGGLEDWEFWLRCASHGAWGATIPEFLDWYRRRADHGDRWHDWGSNGDGLAAFRARLRVRYPSLWNGAFPAPEREARPLTATLAEGIPWDNSLGEEKPRLLLIAPWLAMGGADKFNLDLVGEFTRRGWEVTIATTIRADHPWLPQFSALTPDVFALGNFLHTDDYPRFLRYLIASRRIRAVLISNSEAGYRLLPYLRAHAPGVAFLDYCHMEELHWNAGGYVRRAIDYQPFLDRNVVSSEHLRSWMVQQGADPKRIQVRHTNVDTGLWRPDADTRAVVRRRLGISDDTPLVLYLGRLCEQKQPRVFGHTVRLLAQRGVRFVACVAGDGPDEGWLREFVTRERLHARIRLLGAQPSNAIRELLTAGDVFFLPSQWEGIALSIYEAMACGLPIVGADVGGQRELVTPDCGVLIPRSDPMTEARRYADEIGALLTDQERRREMGSRGRARVASAFPLKDMGEAMVRLVEQSCEEAVRQSRSLLDPRAARIAAIQAVEYLRLADAFVELEQKEVRRAKQSASWRARTYFTVQRVLGPYYLRALERDVRWIVPLKETLKRRLLRRPDSFFEESSQP